MHRQPLYAEISLLPGEGMTQKVIPFSRWGTVGLIVPSFFIYVWGFGYGFTEIDDGGQVLQNQAVLNLSWESIKIMFTTSVVKMYQPITSLNLSFLVAIFGIESATSFHVFSYLVHALNTMLVFYVAVSLVQDRSKAVLIALLFSVHPLRVESVAWISATSTILFTFFFLLAMWFYILYLNKGHLIFYGLSLLAFIFGGFSKVLVVPFLGVMILLDVYWGRSFKNWRIIGEKVPFILMMGFFSYMALHFRAGNNGFPGYPYDPSLMSPIQVVWYPIKTLLPFQLSVLYDWPPELGGLDQILGYGLCALFLGSLYIGRRSKLYVFGILFYLGLIVLHTSLVSSFLAPFSDRYAYLSTLGLLLAWVGIIPQETFQRVGRYVGWGLTAIFFGLSVKQIKVWQSTESVWSNNLLHQSATFSNGMRGAIYYQRRDFGRALEDFTKVAENPDSRLDPEKYAFLYNGLGVMNADKDPDKALEYFKKATSFAPGSSSYTNLARMQAKAGDFKGAEEVLRKVIENEPQNTAAYDQLVGLLFGQGKFQDLLPLMDQLVELAPDSYLNFKRRAYILLKLNRLPEARQDVDRAHTIMKGMGVDPSQDLQLNEVKNLLEMKGM